MLPSKSAKGMKDRTALPERVEERVGPQRGKTTELLIHLEAFSYRLRIALALMEEHNRTVLCSQATEYQERLLRDMLEAYEDAATFLPKLAEAAIRAQEEAGLGS